MKKTILALGVFLLICCVVFAAGFAIEPSTSVHVVTEESACPVVGCTSGECHGFDNVPAPDGEHEMICPEAGCASVECHAWDTLMGRYHQASNASLNLWILMPVALAVVLMLVVRKVR